MAVYGKTAAIWYCQAIHTKALPYCQVLPSSYLVRQLWEETIYFADAIACIYASHYAYMRVDRSSTKPRTRKTGLPENHQTLDRAC
jgi:hypothetical protein